MKEPVFTHCDRCDQEAIDGVCMCGTSEFEEGPQPDFDDSVGLCPDCERPNQFGELCAECTREREIGYAENRQ